MAVNKGKRGYSVTRCRVDIVIPGADGDQRVMLYADSAAAADLLQRWIYKMLDLREYRLARYNLVDMSFIMDPKSVHEVSTSESRFAKFSSYRKGKARGRLDVCIKRDALHGGDIDLSFYAATRDDLHVLTMYLKKGLAGANCTMQCYTWSSGKWEPWVEAIFIRKDRAEFLYGLSPENAEEAMNFVKRLTAGEEVVVLSKEEYLALKPEESAKEVLETGNCEDTKEVPEISADGEDGSESA